MPEQITQEQIVETVTQNAEDYGAQIPEHAILRLARFFLPKMQADLQQNEKQPCASTTAARTFEEIYVNQ